MDIQTELPDNALVTAIRANLCEFFRHVSRCIPEECFEDGKYTRWYTRLLHPWFNGVLSSQMPTNLEEPFIRQTIEYFHEKKIGAFTWWMEPHLQRSDWEPLLSKHGFRFSDDTPGMAADLQALNEPAQTVDGLEVRVVADEESLRTWTHIFASGYGLPDEWENDIYTLWWKLGLGYPLRNFIGYLNDKPVATSCLFFGAGVAGVYSVSTLPEVRGKGIGAAVTLRPLLNARDMGSRIGVLQSSEMGYNIYKKLGFKHLCQIEYFYRSLA